jgi:3-oxoacyl-[acyl-carrier-protein] synthase III
MPEAVRAAITGLGVAVPEGVMTNADFEKILDTSDEWITQRTGIKERHIVAPGQSTASLGTTAARNALIDAKLQATDLDLIICATVTPEMVMPATACVIQAEIGATDVPAFDLSAACSGFIYAVSVASKFIETKTYRRVLVIGAETLSRFTDYTDRGSCVIFGDGAGAVILEASQDPNRGLLYSVLHTDGTGWNYIHVPAGGSRHPATAQTVEDGDHFIKMRGRDVYKFAVEKMQWLLGDCMAKCNLAVKDVDLVIPHQVNFRIIESAAEKFNFPMEKVFINIAKYGNTSSASIPLALQNAREDGRIGPGSTLLLVAFGAGLTWAGAVVRM